MAAKQTKKKRSAAKKSARAQQSNADREELPNRDRGKTYPSDYDLETEDEQTHSEIVEEILDDLDEDAEADTSDPAELDFEHEPQAAARTVRRPSTRTIEVKRTLRFAKAWHWKDEDGVQHSRIFAPGDEDQLPDDFPEGPHWSDYPLPPEFTTIDKNGREASMLPEGVDPSAIIDNVRSASRDAATVRSRKEALAALGPGGANRISRSG